VTAILAAYGGADVGTVPVWLRYTVWAVVALAVVIYLGYRWTHRR
jgi:hypothetical protein